MTSNGLYTNEPRPRLCHLRRWPDFNGYGFNLHCEKAKPGQYIGKVDPNSPAESAGLRENDRIIEVNFVPIGNENHKQVVARIKEGVSRNNTRYSDEVILLVVDQQTDEYYRKKSQIIRSTDANVEKLETEIREDSHYPQQPSPQTRPKDKYVVDQTETYHKNTNSSPAISRTSEQDYDPSEDNQSSHRSTPPVSDKDKRKEYSASTNSYTNKNPSPKSPVRDFHQTRTTTTSSQSSASANGDGGLLNFHMSAAEYREKLKAQSARKRDPRQSQQMSMKEKHQVIDQL